MSHYTSADLFPDWYKNVEITISTELVEKRINAIKNIIILEDVELWLDIVRLALDLSVSSPDNKVTFESNFREEDITFPLTSNENLIKVLAEICLCFLFESSTEMSRTISLAVINANIFEQYPKSNVPYYSYASECLADDFSEDPIDIADFEKALIEKQEQLEGDENNVDSNDHLDMITMINYLRRENKKLKEETNVLWWLFGQYSSLNNAYFNEAGVSKMVIASAEELFALNHTNQPLPSANHIINKVLAICNNNKAHKNISLADSIIAAAPKVKEKILAHGNRYELTPFLYAVDLANQFKVESIWKPAFNDAYPGFDAEKMFSPREIAFQFFNEISFLKSLELLRNE